MMLWFGAVVIGIGNLLLFGLLVVWRRLVHKEDFDSFLISSGRCNIRLFWEGAGLGFILTIVYSSLVLLSNNASVFFYPENIYSFILLVVFMGFSALGVALFEEAFFRGYILPKLLQYTNPYIAVAIPSLVFGLVHYWGYSTSPLVIIGMTNAMLIGAVLSIIVLKTGSLMMVVGFHLFWNLCQELVTSRQSVIILELRRGIWAGAYGNIEVGLATTVTITLLLIYVLFRFNKGWSTKATIPTKV